MKGGNRAKGFTIVETLIVLAVSGTMLVSVISMISGQQGKSQFQSAINNVAQQLQQSIDDVANGYYPTSNIMCSASGGVPVITFGNSGLGSNQDCILVGKVIVFDSTDLANQKFVAYPMVDLRTGSNINSRIAIARGSRVHTNVPDNSVKTSLGAGLAIVYSGQSGVTFGTVGFGLIMSNISNSGIGADISGSQSTGIYSISNTKSTNSSVTNVDNIDTLVNYVASTNGYNICLASGTTNQSGLISIGSGAGRKLSVTLTIKDGLKC